MTRYKRLVRDRYRASLMSDVKWRAVLSHLASYDPPFHVWIRWIDGGDPQEVEVPVGLDEDGAVFGDLGWRPYLAIERLTANAYVQRPRKSKLSSYQPVEAARRALKAMGKLPLEGSPNGGFRIVAHLAPVTPLTDADCARLEPPFDDFARALFAAYPEWRDCAEIMDYGGVPYLWLEVPPSPEADMNSPLWIGTSGGEITLGLDYAHAHFDWPADDRDSPLDYIDHILNERVVAFEQFVGDWAAMGGMCASDEPIRVTELKVSRLRVRSWRGTHNRDETFAWPPSKR